MTDQSPPAGEELDNAAIIPPRASLNLVTDLPGICLLANNNIELWPGGGRGEGDEVSVFGR